MAHAMAPMALPWLLLAHPMAHPMALMAPPGSSWLTLWLSWLSLGSAPPGSQTCVQYFSRLMMIDVALPVSAGEAAWQSSEATHPLPHTHNLVR